jgi:selenocysteine-specific elongation factor
VLDAHPGRRHRRFQEAAVQRLATLAEGAPADILLQALSRLEPVTQADLLRQCGLDQAVADAAWQELLAAGEIVALDGAGRVMSAAGWRRLSEQSVSIVSDYQRQWPLRPGMPREELRSRLRLAVADFGAAVIRARADGLLQERGAHVALPSHEIRFGQQQQLSITALQARLTQAGVSSPSPNELRATLGDELYYALVELGELHPLNDDVVYGAAEYERLTGQIRRHLAEHGRISAAEARDLLGASRKYAIALLEHLDDIKVTRRVGDERVLR